MFPYSVEAAYRFDSFSANPPIHVFKSQNSSPQGLSPADIRAVYHLPKTGGKGTIAIISAYEDTSLEKDLGVFNTEFKLPACNIKNGCLIKHKISTSSSTTITNQAPFSEVTSFGSNTKSSWNLETSLDVEWAHAIAPNAKILVVVAPTPSGKNLLKAIDYARSRSDVVAVSMSWGGLEFPDELSLDSHFISKVLYKNPEKNSTATPATSIPVDKKYSITFFAASGDAGTGVSWPASSPNVVAVGGTSLRFSPLKVSTSTNYSRSSSSAKYSTSTKKLLSETAWDGSGGGISAYEPIPQFQKEYNLPKNKGMRSVPDVSFNADPVSGYSVFALGKWYVIGGTSAGAPQWAAIKALGLSASNINFYADKAKESGTSYFRDIISGANGDCGYVCNAKKRYDYVTGLGSPLTTHF